MLKSGALDTTSIFTTDSITGEILSGRGYNERDGMKQTSILRRISSNDLPPEAAILAAATAGESLLSPSGELPLKKSPATIVRTEHRRCASQTYSTVELHPFSFLPFYQ
jgi:hypothetical protein